MEGPARTALKSERLREPSLQKLSQLRRRFELRNWIKLFEREWKRGGVTPDCPWSELLVLRFEIKNRAQFGQGAWELRVFLPRKLPR